MQMLWTKTLKTNIGSIAIINYTQMFATGGFDGIINIWNFSNLTEVAALTGHTDEVYMLAISHSERFMISLSLDYTLRIWNIQFRKQINVFQVTRVFQELVITNDDEYFILQCMLLYDIVAKKLVGENVECDIVALNAKYKEIRKFINN